jgi:hypothetical protein
MWLGFRPEERALRVSLIAPGLVAAALALVGCGSQSDYANDPRPPVPINISASISPDKITVSPHEFGAGPVTFLIANLTEDSQQVTIETQDLAATAGIKQTSSVINPQGTATLKLDVKEGDYTVSVESSSIKEAHMQVSAERESSQDQLLQP